MYAKPSCNESITGLFQKTSKSVVFISAISIDPFKLSNRVGSVIGSGFIIDKNGIIMTNSHVVFGRKAIAITLDKGETVQAELLGADPITDIAVLRIPAPPEGYAAIPFGDSEHIQVGEEVVAIGNPYGLEQTLTLGVVSGLNRILPVSPMSLTLPMIQTDAAINPGNSGGPLINRCGEVIGINTSVLGTAENIGFAVPIHIANPILHQLVKYGRVIRSWIGVNGKLIGRELGQIINVPLVEGFLVETIEPGSPAQKAGLHEGLIPFSIAGAEFLLGGDIITSVNGKSLNDPGKFPNIMRTLKIGDKVRLKLFYEGEEREVELTIVERPVLPGDLPPGEQRMLGPDAER